MEDLLVDEIHLVGTNLDGFMSLLLSELDSYLAALKFDSAEDRKSNLKKIQSLLRVSDHEHSWNDLERRDKKIDELCQRRERFFALQGKCLETGDGSEILEFAKGEFKSKIKFIVDAGQGNSLASHFIRETPLGMKHSIHGIQNIKGPGLIWLELWEEWAQFLAMVSGDEARERLEELFSKELESKKFKNNLFCQYRVYQILENKNSIQSLLKDKSDTDDGPQDQKGLGVLKSKVSFALRELMRPVFEVGRVHAANKIYRDFSKKKIDVVTARKRIRLAVRALLRYFRSEWGDTDFFKVEEPAPSWKN